MRQILIILSLFVAWSCQQSKHTPTKVETVMAPAKKPLKLEKKDIPGNEETAAPEQQVVEPTTPHQGKGPRTIVQTVKVKKFCQKIQTSFTRYKWGKSGCDHIQWHHVRNSILGDPLIWTVFGNEKAHKSNLQNATMFFCGVHGDEITPIKFCFDLIHHLEENYHKHYPGTLIVVAPVVNPDSFFKRRPTRTNAKGVDINRNFPTNDWYQKAIQLWQRRYRSDKRRYPGKKPKSEPEVVFQVNLLARYNPGKIISVHAPLTMIDYDGPGEGLSKTLKKTGKGAVASQLLIQMSKKADGYKVKNYPFFPGSLGNYAGNERNIPTITLELPSSDYTKTRKFWNLFKGSIHDAIITDMRPCALGPSQGCQTADASAEIKGKNLGYKKDDNPAAPAKTAL